VSSLTGVLIGGAGADTLIGGNDTDLADYAGMETGNRCLGLV